MRDLDFPNTQHLQAGRLAGKHSDEGSGIKSSHTFIWQNNKPEPTMNFRTFASPAIHLFTDAKIQRSLCLQQLAICSVSS
jgi:hypothetical protein